ncbi:hypothetical protein SK128_010360 [Halocaridina rubra]|uniref:Uncharacterized protein n=1 Tax=Halocaridina rubra TaxID=373956 RepID=A0AAN9AG43_HALRR
MLSEYTRNELRAHVGARSTGGGGGGGPTSPSPSQQQQQQQPPQQQQQQQQTAHQQQQQHQTPPPPPPPSHLAFQQPPDHHHHHHHHHLDQPLLHSYSPSENNNWSGENVNTSQAGGLNASPRMDDNRGSTGGEKGKSESMLKHLLSK